MSATTQNEFNAAAQTANAENEKKAGMSGWGCALRITGAVLLFVAVVCAISYVASLGLTAIAGMELTAMMANVATWGIVGVTYVTSMVIGWWTGVYCTDTLSARQAAKCAA